MGKCAHKLHESAMKKRSRVAEKRQAQQNRVLEGVDEELRRRSALLRVQEEQRLQHQWGVRLLPDGVKLGSLGSTGDCLYCELQLHDGSYRCGPCRRTLVAVQKDVVDFRFLQASLGDVAASVEMDRRDLEAMTMLFM